MYSTELLSVKDHSLLENAFTQLQGGLGDPGDFEHEHYAAHRIPNIITHPQQGELSQFLLLQINLTLVLFSVIAADLSDETCPLFLRGESTWSCNWMISPGTSASGVQLVLRGAIVSLGGPRSFDILDGHFGLLFPVRVREGGRESM